MSWMLGVCEEQWGEEKAVPLGAVRRSTGCRSGCLCTASGCGGAPRTFSLRWEEQLLGIAVREGRIGTVVGRVLLKLCLLPEDQVPASLGPEWQSVWRETAAVLRSTAFCGCLLSG